MFCQNRQTYVVQIAKNSKNVNVNGSETGSAVTIKKSKRYYFAQLPFMNINTSVPPPPPGLTGIRQMIPPMFKP
jgi:hypothetical protein